ncbi:MAG: dienelactone hydrolase family protein [Agarilytica sp.]
MKSFKIVIAIVIAIPVLFVALGTVLPAQTHVERDITIDAPQGVVFYLVSQHKQFQKWSPWAKIDPAMKVDFSGPDLGVGSMMTWSGNQEVGSGTSVFTEYVPNSRAVTSLDFGQMGSGIATYDLELVGTNQTKITWGFDTRHRNFIEKYFGLMMDAMLGAVYEDGLAELKTLAENFDPVITERVSYEVEGTEYQGFLAYPAGELDPIPGVVVIHGLWGQTVHERRRAKMLAESGYVAFALDLYGDGLTTTNLEDAINLMESVGENSNVTVSLFDAAVEQLENHHGVDKTKVAAVGYSVGGPIAMNMARRGKHLMGVASFYGGFGGLSDIVETAFTPVMVFNGGADEFSVKSQRVLFEEQLTESNIPYEIVDYPDATHGFSDQASDEIAQTSGIAFIGYNKQADEDSWQKLTQFLSKVFYQ